MTYYSPGRYRCDVVNQGFGNSKQKGTPYFYLTVRPVDRILGPEEFEPCPERYEREVIMYLTDNTVERVVKNLRALGWDGSDWADLDPLTGNYFSFDGRQITCSCDHEQNDDKVYERWQLSGGGFEHERNSDVVRSINAMFGKALKGGRPKAKPPTKRETVPPDNSGGEQDQIPF